MQWGKKPQQKKSKIGKPSRSLLQAVCRVGDGEGGGGERGVGSMTNCSVGYRMNFSGDKILRFCEGKIAYFLDFTRIKF